MTEAADGVPDGTTVAETDVLEGGAVANPADWLVGCPEIAVPAAVGVVVKLAAVVV